MRGFPKRFFTFFENFGLQMPEKIEWALVKSNKAPE
jgi:hypothetical protein